jgi:hypothetical protein
MFGLKLEQKSMIYFNVKCQIVTQELGRQNEELRKVRQWRGIFPFCEMVYCQLTIPLSAGGRLYVLIPWVYHF